MTTAPMTTAKPSLRTGRSRLLAATVAALLLTVGAAAAHEGATGVVGERMNLMKDMGQRMKALGSMISAKTPFDPATARQLAAVMQEHCRHMAHLFPEGSGGHHSDAKPTVWSKRAEFEDRLRRFDVAVGELVTAAASGDMATLKAPFKQVSQECSGCHDGFREKN